MTVENQGGSPQDESTPESVDSLRSMSDEELDQLTAEFDSRDVVEEEESTEDVEQEAEEPEPERPQPEETGEDVSQLKTKLKELEEKLSKRDQERTQRETHIQRLKTQLGEAKKQLTERRQQVEQYLEENQDSPREVAQATLALREIDAHLGQVTEKEADLVEEDRSRTLFEKHFNDTDTSFEDIASLVLERDNLPAEYVQEFRKNPFRFASGSELIQMGKRAQLEKLTDRMVPIMRALIAENRELKKGKETVVSRIEKELRRAPSIATQPSATRKKQVNRRDIASLTDAELDELEKNF